MSASWAADLNVSTIVRRVSRPVSSVYVLTNRTI
jgi:hypothetical protein